MKDRIDSNVRPVRGRSPPVGEDPKSQERSLREFARVLGQLVGQRWLHQQADRGDTPEASPAKRKRPTASLGKLDGESE